jgi:hypothetical protein
MGGVAKVLGGIAPVVSVVGSLFGIGTSLFGGKKNISVPPLPTIPTPDYQSLQAQITANTAISDQARTAAIQALQSYNQGTLSPTYQAMYQNYLEQLDPQIKKIVAAKEQELAAKGFVQGSTEYNKAMQDVMTQIEGTKAAYRNQLLQQQLNDAMTAAGLSETTIKELQTQWGMQQDAYNNQMSNWQAQVYGSALQSQNALNKANLLGGSLANLGTSLESLGGTSFGSTGTTSQYPNLTTPWTSSQPTTYQGDLGKKNASNDLSSLLKIDTNL